jgi:hypothetical protein
MEETKIDIDDLLIDVVNKDSTKGELYYARKFKSCYEVVRKSLVIIKKSRKEIGNKVAVLKTKQILEKALKSLEN